jgi:O-succinylbenzoic acid--CoA ligase
VNSLLALDFELGPALERAIRDAVDHQSAFTVLDRRLAPRRRDEQLAILGATHVLDEKGRTTRSHGQPVDDDIGLVILTSGSSGEPKAVELTWDALRASADMTQSTLRVDGASPVWFPCLPACHIGGLAVLLRAILSDATLHWGVDDDIDSAPLRGATHIALVRPQLLRHDTSGYAKVLLGGAKPPVVLPENVIATWGMTETGSGVIYDGTPLPGVEVASVQGELCVRTPTLFRSYRTSPRPHVVGPDGLDDWFPTGDGGDVVNGIVSVRGRLGFVINTGGEKLWPEELEAVLGRLPGVRDIAVTGVDDAQWGQRVVALVVGDGTNLDRPIADAAREAIGPWAKPKEVRYVAAIPRTTNGKIRRRELEHLH